MSLLRHSLLKRLADSLEKEASALRWIDLYAAQYVADCDVEAADDEVVKLALLLSFSGGQGKTCLDLDNLPTETMPGFALNNKSSDQWRTRLLQSAAVRDAEAGESSSHAPLVLQGKHLYLARYWCLQMALEQWLVQQSDTIVRLEDETLDALAHILKKVFNLSDPVSIAGEPDWQALAAAHTLLQKFTLITGGPGTGKTTTVASILYLLMQRHRLQASTAEQAHKLPIVRLLAPTGKAAVKLAASIQQHLRVIEQKVSLESMSVGQFCQGMSKLSDHLRHGGETIHRFLYQHGALRDHLNHAARMQSRDILLGKQDAHCAAVDVVVIDEGSMMDLNLMVELIRILPASTQLIMLGDHYQLAPVEPGQVFVDCVNRYAGQSLHPDFLKQLSRLTAYPAAVIMPDAADGETPALCQPLCQLKKTYRFGGDLKHAAEWIKSGQCQAFRQHYQVTEKQQRDDKELRWHPVDDSLSAGLPLDDIISGYASYFDLIQNDGSLQALSSAFDRYQILCSTHEGPFGVRYINQLIETHFGYSAAPYHGKAVLVTRNQAHLGVFNGDVGFVQKTPAGLEICFPHIRTDDGNDCLQIAFGRLREWQPAYAMTVHKSQGSEYQHVGVVLADYAKELLSRELLYTAVTRSKQTCDIWAGEVTIERAISQTHFTKRPNKL